jgi:hypothetical protein
MRGLLELRGLFEGIMRKYGICKIIIMQFAEALCFLLFFFLLCRMPQYVEFCVLSIPYVYSICMSMHEPLLLDRTVCLLL